MADTRSPEQRRRIMQAVGTADTGPELAVRSMLHALGYRYRLHGRDLPGKPDIVFRSRRKAIFVHGCFWHGHACAKGKLPKSRLDYWSEKIRGNVERDARAENALRERGWRVIAIWQCEVRDRELLKNKLTTFLAENKTRSTGAGKSITVPS